MKVLPRCDASDASGIGHVVRYLTLADAARPRGWETVLSGALDVALARRPGRSSRAPRDAAGIGGPRTRPVSRPRPAPTWCTWTATPSGRTCAGASAEAASPSPRRRTVTSGAAPPMSSWTPRSPPRRGATARWFRRGAPWCPLRTTAAGSAQNPRGDRPPRRRRRAARGHGRLRRDRCLRRGPGHDGPQRLLGRTGSEGHGGQVRLRDEGRPQGLRRASPRGRRAAGLHSLVARHEVLLSAAGTTM